jgi:hypothetical protein
MKKLFLASIVAILFSILMNGCGGDGCTTATTPPPTNVDPNAPIAKLDPTLLDIEFD